MKFVRIEQTEREWAISAFSFIRADFAEGLNYSIAVEFYNRAMKALDSSKVITKSVRAEQFLEDFRKEIARTLK